MRLSAVTLPMVVSNQGKHCSLLAPHRVHKGYDNAEGRAEGQPKPAMNPCTNPFRNLSAKRPTSLLKEAQTH
jgi:hypothetical protein